MALGASPALHQRGLRIPEHVSVVSFDNSDLAVWLLPGLGSVDLPCYEMGRLSVRLLVGSGERSGVHLVPLRPVARDPVGPPAP